MSIVSLTIRDDYLLMGCDGVSTDTADGSIHGFMSKLTLLPELNAIIGITGMGGFDHLMRWFMADRFADFDDLVPMLPELVQHTHEQVYINGLAQCEDHRTNVTLGGWSSTNQRFEAYRVTTYPKESINSDTKETTVLEPFVLHPMRMRGIWSSAAPDQEILERFGALGGIDEDDGAAMTRMICAARADSGRECPDYPEGVGFNAGGFVQLALLIPGHIQSWIAHRWPEDVPGEQLDPTRGEPMPEYLARP